VHYERGGFLKFARDRVRWISGRAGVIFGSAFMYILNDYLSTLIGVG
jgi:hypothetical protein